MKKLDRFTAVLIEVISDCRRLEETLMLLLGKVKRCKCSHCGLSEHPLLFFSLLELIIIQMRRLIE